MDNLRKRLSSIDLWIDILVFIAIFIACIIIYQALTPSINWIAGNEVLGSSSPAIVPGNTISQPFTAVKNNLSEIKVVFLKQDKEYPEDGTIDWILAEEGDSVSVVASGSIKVGEIENVKPYSIQFPVIKDSKFKRYILILSTSNLPEGINLPTSLQAQAALLAYQVNGIDQDGTIQFYMGYSKPDFSQRILLIELIIALLLYLVYLFRRPIGRILNSIPIHEIAFVIILVFGMLFLIIEPPLKMFDEPEHFRRVWDVSQGEFSVGEINGVVSNRLPDYIQKTYDRINRSVVGTSQNPTQLLWMLFEPAGDVHQLSSKSDLVSSYSFFAYLLPALFVRLGTLFKISALGLIYLARLANLVQYLALTTWALKNARIGKYTIAILATAGLVLTEGAAIGVDGLLFGGSFLFLASLVNLAFANPKETPRTGEVWGLVVGALCILFSKHVYIPLLGLILIIPAAKFGSLKKKLVFSSIFLISGFLLAVFLQSQITIGTDPRINYSHINMKMQLDYVTNHPLAWMGILFNTLFTNAFVYFDQLNLLNSSYTSIGLMGIGQIFAVFFFSWSESREIWGKIRKIDYVTLIVVIALTLMAIALPLYLTWTPVKAPLVEGLQGRYFVPVITAILLFFKPPFTGKSISYNLRFILTTVILLTGQLYITSALYY